MLADGSVEKLLVLRMKELCDRESEWYRRLWRLGTVGQLRELLTLGSPRASAGAREHALSTSRALADRDPALSGPRKGAVLRALPKTKDLDRFSAGNYSFNVLLHEVNLLEDDYLKLWIKFFENNLTAGGDTDVDLYSQLIAAHLRTVGFSSEWIVNFCNYELEHKVEDGSLGHMIAQIDSIREKGSGDWLFLIPVSKRTRIDSKATRPWHDKRSFGDRFRELFPQEDIPEHVGGLEFHVNALDKYSAITQVRRAVTQAESRVRVGGGRRQLQLSDIAWVNPGSFSVNLWSRRSRAISIPAIDAEGGLHTFFELPEQMESSLDLIAGFGMGTERSNCISAWAAVESLLADREDFGQIAQVAGRAADILTCRLLVLEISALAKTHSRAGKDVLSETLRGALLEDQVMITIRHLQEGGALAVGRGVGKVRLFSVQDLLASPQKVRETRNGLEAAFVRLYRARNSIVHSGEIEPHGFLQIMASAEVLLGALLDVVIAHFRTTGEPAGLAAVKAAWVVENIVESGSFDSLSSVI